MAVGDKVGTQFIVGFSKIGPVYSRDTPGVEFVTPSYLYTWYDDDPDLQAFVRAYNDVAQGYLDWFNQIGLPNYPELAGALLDWVAAGLYGMGRPVISSGTNQWVGPLDTWALNTIPLDTAVRVGPTTIYAVTDDFFKRILTWHLYKADGKYFNVRWLKRRIMRFLNGEDGEDGDASATYQVSVTFGVSNQVNITILSTVRTLLGGCLPGTFAPDTADALPDFGRTSATTFAPLAGAPTLKAAIDSGVLELPATHSYVVTI